MKRTLTLSTILLLAATGGIMAQYTPPDPSGFQGLIVEPYYVANAQDASDTDGSSELEEGAVTYRVFVDLKPGYKLLTVGGFPSHPFTINTSTILFNNDDRGEAWGDDINDIHLNKNSVMIDSWLSMGAASDAHWGVLKADDPDGSLVNNDGGSTGSPMLANSTSAMGIPLGTADGLYAPSVPPSITYVGSAPAMFDPAGPSSYSDDNFAWAVLGGVQGPDTANRILIGQFTTDGVLDVCFNLWVRIPDTLVCNDPNCHEIMEFYATLLPSDTAGGGFGADNKFTHPTLCFNSGNQQVDCLGVPGGPALPGTACDDGNADTQNDVYDANCTCLGEDCLGVPGGNALPGEPCDDGDPNTANDTWQTGCICSGINSVQELAPAPAVTVSPNPTRDVLRIGIADLSGQHVVLTLRNALGQTVLTQDLGPMNGDRQQVLDLGGQATGVYFLEVTVGAQRTVKRVSKL